jgi:hypothetical protein
MTPRQWEQIGLYVRGIADQLGLRDWHFNLIEEEAADPDAWATILCLHGRRVADIRLCADWMEIDAEQQRHSVVHELLHCHLENVANHVNDHGLDKLIGEPAAHLLEQSFRRDVEHAVDAIATAIRRRARGGSAPRAGPPGRRTAAGTWSGPRDRGQGGGGVKSRAPPRRPLAGLASAVATFDALLHSGRRRRGAD